MTSQRIDISYRTVIFIALFIILLWVIYLIRDVILLFFVAFILMSALAPLVSRLTRWKIPRILAIAIIFLLLIGCIVGVVTVGFTPLINQISELSQNLIRIVGGLLRSNYIDQSIVNQEISNLSHNIVSFTFSLFQNFISFVSVIVITFYMLLDREKIETAAIALFSNQQAKITRLIEKVEYKLGAWLRGQMILSLFIAILVYVGLTLLGISNALPLALIAGLLEVVPVIGPIIAAIPAVLVAFTISPLSAALVTGLYLAIQQIEGHLVVPQVMKRAVGLNPLLVILAITVGGRLLGIAGALLAVPIAVVIQVIVEEVLRPENT